MKLNWAERLVVNNPLRALEQSLQMGWLKRRSILREGAVALEIGCGRGAGARLILKEFQPAHLHIMDLDDRMVEKAKRHLSHRGKERVTCYVADAARLPYKTGSLDAVFGFGFLHHVPDWRAALTEVHRVLRIGGIYLLEEIYPPLYLNFLARHLMVHPMHDRFYSHDLRETLDRLRLPVKEALEFKMWGMLGIAVKEE